jgi:hypothetical protein
MADLLAKYVDLRYPATRANIRTLLEHVPDEPESTVTKEALKNWLAEGGKNKKDDDLPRMLWENHIRVVDLLEEYPDIDLPLEQFLKMLQPMRARNVCCFILGFFPFTVSKANSLRSTPSRHPSSQIQNDSRSLTRCTSLACAANFLRGSRTTTRSTLLLKNLRTTFTYLNGWISR